MQAFAARPMTRHQSALDFFRAVDDPQRFRGDRAARQRRARAPARGFVLSQCGDHPGFQPAPRLRMDRGMDGLGADQARRILGVPSPVVLEPMANHRPDPELARNLRRRPAPVDQLAPHKVMEPAAAGELVPPSAPLAARPISGPATLRAIGLGGLSLGPTPAQFPTDRRGAAPQSQAYRPKARAPRAGAPPKSRHLSSLPRWDGCRPPQTASQCAKMVVFNATETERTAR